MEGDLRLRLTNKYVGTYQYEDEWRYIGRYVIIATERWRLDYDDDQDPDPTEPMKQIYNLEIEDLSNDCTVEDVKKAIQDSFSHFGCHHEYDCCGCRSFYAKKPVNYSDDGRYYTVEVNSWRNY